MTNLFARFVKEEDGATAIEYGLIAAILAIGIIAAVQGVKDDLNDTFNKVGTELDNANG